MFCTKFDSKSKPAARGRSKSRGKSPKAAMKQEKSTPRKQSSSRGQSKSRGKSQSRGRSKSRGKSMGDCSCPMEQKKSPKQMKPKDFDEAVDGHFIAYRPMLPSLMHMVKPGVPASIMNTMMNSGCTLKKSAKKTRKWENY
jgi:hypothetical protein